MPTIILDKVLIVIEKKSICQCTWDSPDSSVGKVSTCNAGDPSSIPGSGSFTVEELGYPLQYSCLGNPKDRGAWWATVHGAAIFGHDLENKQQKQYLFMVSNIWLNIQNL